MKVIASGDNHCDEAGRWDEWVRVHGWMVGLVVEQRPDLFICPGDIYERASTPRERGAVADWLTAIAEVCHVVVTKGNHERKLDAALLSRLKSKHPIYVEEAASVQYIAGAAIACVAWPDRASVLLASGSASTEDADLTAQDALRAVLRGLGQKLAAHDGPRILAGHFMISGAVTSVGQPLIGMSMNVGLEDLALACADITLASHIHCPQHWTHGGAPFVYCGSPIRSSYGETEEKSVVIVEFGDDGRLASWRRVPTPCSPMLLITVDSAEDLQPDDKDYTRALVRVRYGTDPDARVPARGYAEKYRDWLLERGAAEVKIEEVVRTTDRTRAPEIAQATTLDHKLIALWSARGTTPEPERSERLLAEARRLEGEVQNG